MAALNRLGQRIKENFQETTRDISLLAGGSGSSNAAYFDTSDDKIKEIGKLLDSRHERDRLEGMKRIIAGISKGRDMEPFFAQVVKNVVAPSIEIRKLVYIYLLRFASTNSDLLLLSINTFQKDLSDPSPLIRSMSLRVLTSIRVPIIQGIVMLGLKKLVNDRNPWVRKTVAGGLAKVYETDQSTLSQLIPLLQTLLAAPSPLTLGASLTAFYEICPDQLHLLHPHYRHICRIIADADEWAQIVAIDVLSRYARTFLEKPETAGGTRPNARDPKATEEEDDFDGLDLDLAMFLDCIRPLFQSRNPAVILATATAYFHLAPAGNMTIGQELLVEPLLRLANGTDSRVGAELSTLAWDAIEGMAAERPWLFEAHQSQFFVCTADPDSVKTNKVRAMSSLVSATNAKSFMREFKHYIRFPSDTVACAAVHAIGRCIRTQPAVAATGQSALMKLLRSRRDVLVSQSVLVLKSVILAQAGASDPQLLVARLANQLDAISNPTARASVFWLVGQYAASDAPPPLGLGWEGVAPWVPDILRKAINRFIDEDSTAKLQILTLATKVLVLAPSIPLLSTMSQYLFSLARYDADYDVRDRSRFLHSLLKGVIVKPNLTDGDEEENESGGVVLRREQVKVVVLGQRAMKDEVDTSGGVNYQVGSMSRAASRRLAGYHELPEWTDDPTDSSLRDSERDREPEAATVPVPQSFSSTTPPVHVSSSAASIPKSMGNATPSYESPGPASLVQKSKFQDLDAFLNSETESESEEEYESEAENNDTLRPIQVPPRSAIVPEYDEDVTTDEEMGSSDDDDDDERRALNR